MKTTLTLDKEDKKTIKDYTNELDITQADFIKILLKTYTDERRLKTNAKNNQRSSTGL